LSPGSNLNSSIIADMAKDVVRCAAEDPARAQCAVEGTQGDDEGVTGHPSNVPRSAVRLEIKQTHTPIRSESRING